MANSPASTNEILRKARDASTYALETIDYAHHEIHDGSSFIASGTADIAANGTATVLFVTPAGAAKCHLLIELNTELEAQVNFYEDFVAGLAGTIGTSVTAYNRNRNSATAPTAAVYVSPSIGTANGTAGTKLQQWHWGSGRDAGGDSRALHEYVLDDDSKYMLEIINFSGSAANYVNWTLDWYEHEDKE